MFTESAWFLHFQVTVSLTSAPPTLSHSGADVDRTTRSDDGSRGGFAGKVGVGAGAVGGAGPETGAHDG
jgi:hypothetical protein